MQSAGNYEITRLRNYPISSSNSFTWFACILFVLLGVVTTLLGPILPLLPARWSIAPAQAGALFSWEFVSSTIGTLLSGIVLARRSFRVAIVPGILLCMVGVAELIRADWTFGRYAVACYGFGLGVALPAINLAVAEANPQRRAGSVSWLNFAWGIGAISGPVLLRVTHSLETFLMLVSALLLAGFLAASITSMPSKKDDSGHQAVSRADGSLWTVVPVIALSMFLFVGIETAVGGWASSLALPHFSNAFTATSANIAFWSFFLAARAFAPWLLRRLTEERLLYISIGVAIAGVLLFFLAAQAVVILIACALAGAGIGPGFPLLISRVSERIGAQHPSATICFTFGGFGAATMPALVGILGARLGQPRAGLLLPLAGLALLVPLTRSLAERKKLKVADATV